MKNKKTKAIKLDDYEITFTLPPDLSVHNLMTDWAKLHQEQSKIKGEDDTNTEEWSSIPGLPQYSFKNLKLVKNEITDCSDDCIEFNFKFDEILNSNKEND